MRVSRLAAPLLLVPAVAAATVDPRVARLEVRALRLVNASREAAGLAPLRHDPALAAAARAHAEDMSRSEYVGHRSPDPARRTPGLRLAAAGVTDAVHAENVGRFGTSRADATAEDLLREVSARLLASPDHAPHLRSPEFTHAGMGVALGTGPADADPTVRVPALYLAQTFVARRAVVRTARARRVASGLRFDLAGELTVPGRARLVTRDAFGDAADVPGDLAGGAFRFSFIRPAAAGRARLDLDIVPPRGGEARPARRWTLDPLQPADLALASGLGEE